MSDSNAITTALIPLRAMLSAAMAVETLLRIHKIRRIGDDEIDTFTDLRHDVAVAGARPHVIEGRVDVCIPKGGGVDVAEKNVFGAGAKRKSARAAAAADAGQRLAMGQQRQWWRLSRERRAPAQFPAGPALWRCSR